MTLRHAVRISAGVGALVVGVAVLSVGPAGAAIAPSATWSPGDPVVVTNTGRVPISGVRISRTRRVDNAGPEDCPAPAGWASSLVTRIRWGTQTASLGPLVVQTCVYRATSDAAMIGPGGASSFSFGLAERVRIASPHLGHLVPATPAT